MATENDVRRIISGLPETSELISAGVPYFRVGRRGFAKLRQSPEALVVYTAGLPEKQALIQSAPGTFFSTEHYDGTVAVLVRLERVEPRQLSKLLAESWRLRAPEEVLQTHGEAATEPVVDGELGFTAAGAEQGQAAPYALPAGGGATYRFGVDFVVKAGELGQGRRVAVVEYTTKAGEEPGNHTHDTEDEMFYVQRGELTFQCGGERFDVAEGGFVFLPRGIEHGYEIRSEGEVRLLAVTAPAPADGASRGWGGFVADFETDGELVD